MQLMMVSSLFFLGAQLQEIPDRFLLVILCLSLQVSLFQSPFNAQEQLGDVKGFRDEIIGPFSHAVDRRVQTAVTGDHDHRNVRVKGAHGLKKLFSPHDRHFQVQENQVHGVLGQ
jgi:hypothetical protein